MATFAQITATTSAVQISASTTLQAPWGITVLNADNNAADAVVIIAAVSTTMTTQGYRLTRGQSTLVSPYEISNATGQPMVENLWIYASTTGQTVCVRY